MDLWARFISLLWLEEDSTPENSQVPGKLTFFYLTDDFISKHKKPPFLPNVLGCEKLIHGSKVSFHLPLWVPEFELLWRCSVSFETVAPAQTGHEHKTNFPFTYKLQIIMKEGNLKDYSKLHTNSSAVSSSVIYDNWLKYWSVEFLL